MWAAVRIGGRLIVEDADFDGWCCHPSNDGFDFFLRSYAEVIRRRGGDHATGRKLYSYFLEAGIATPQIALVQSVSAGEESKELAWSTLDATGEAMLAEGVATPDELAAALASLRQFTDDTATIIARPHTFQLFPSGNQRSVSGSHVSRSRTTREISRVVCR
jgi:hypothetical protein